MDSILKDGRVVRGWLGISVKGIEPEDQLSLEDKSGVQVMEVLPKGPADLGGIQAGDIILSINGEQIKDANHLITYIARQSPNAVIEVLVARGEKQFTANVTVQERPKREVKQPTVEYMPIPIPR